MSERHAVIIGGNIIGYIENLRLDWPHYIGDFVATNAFLEVETIFAAAAKYQRAKQYADFDDAMLRLFRLGIEVRSANGTQIVRRTGVANEPGEIAMVHIARDKISFRVMPKTGSD